MSGTADLLNEFFDHIYVINLERAEDRREHIETIFKDVDFEFFVASDKNNINYQKALEDGLFDEHNEQAMSRFPTKLTLAHIACAHSHRLVYEDIITNGYQRALIFEDDITQLPEPKNLKKAMQELPNNWDVFLLGHLKTKMMNGKRKFDQLIYKGLKALHLFNWQRRSKHYINLRYTEVYSNNLLRIGEFTGLHAYGVSAEGAKKLVKEQTPIRYTADGLVNFTTLQLGSLKTYGILPSLFSQESDGGRFASDISNYKPSEKI